MVLCGVGVFGVQGVSYHTAHVWMEPAQSLQIHVLYVGVSTANTPCFDVLGFLLRSPTMKSFSRRLQPLGVLFIQRGVTIRES
jgi:hypothetical protein